MHDEALNSKSFSKRASPSKNSLPTMFGKGNSGAFCRNCQTNQMLIVNLLSNYLPAPTDPSYQRRLDDLPAYEQSLHARYPPVCEDCLPVIEEEIQRKNKMARSQALGGSLKETKAKERQRRVSATKVDRNKVVKEIVAWRIRGVLWALGVGLSVIGNAIAALGYSTLLPLRVFIPVLPFLVLLSLIWTAWDPTYSSFREAQVQGRDVRIRGKKEYITLQMLAWSSRLVTSSLLAIHRRSSHLDYLHLSRHLSTRSRLYFGLSLLLELIVCLVPLPISTSAVFTKATQILIRSLAVIRIQTPPAIRLIDTDSHKIGFSRSATPNLEPNDRDRSSTPAPTLTGKAASEQDLFSTLSLSSKPVLKAPSHVFGLPSMGPTSSPNEDDQMDWSPTDENASNQRKKQNPDESDSGFWLRPQRFFAPEQPTGLETLFEKTKLSDDVTMSDSTRNESSRRRHLLHMEEWWWLYTAVGVAVLGVGLYLWIHQDHHQSSVQLGSHQSDSDPLNAGVFRHVVRSETDGGGGGDHVMH
ncbi:hypothetical protein V5O48_003401 [Marasmius crinis-equi]|uniref:Ima1 N-terminal domain-containing protein n=1 Tax=Marasmius crinis-equi TaxID=585013 RepID=A0ABR3FT17_9AGAR